MGLSLLMPSTWLLLAFLFLTPRSLAQTCYFPDGTASTDVPCSSDSYTSCCAPVDICLSNGYCMNTGHQPYILSRGSCTDKSWGPNCPQHCYGSLDGHSGGISIVNLLYVNGTATYCCGTPVIVDGSITCPNGEEPFTLPDGEIVPGHAVLANVSSLDAPTTTPSSNNTSGSSSSSSSRDTAIGAGVGVPLGVIALSAIAWALWERRQQQRALATGTTVPMGDNYGFRPMMQPGQYAPPAELDHTQPIPEMDAGRRDK